jgi:phosphatidylglycerol lysyltransferase
MLARRLVLSYGWNSTSYQILNPGISHWFSPGASAVVGYIRRGRVLLAAGAPVCPAEALAHVCAEFEAFARRQRCIVCYVCAEKRLRDVLRGSAHHDAVVIGGQPAWRPALWPELVESRRSLRAQLHRSRNKAVVVETISAAEAAKSRELRRVVDEWVRGRPLPPLHFLVEPDVLDGVLLDRVLLVARRNRRAVALLVASPVPARNGYLIELLARCAEAPNGTVELLVDAAMRRFAAERRDYASLGLVALAHTVDSEIRRNPAWLRPLMYFARAHANRFYNFQGLEHFREKMSPERWEPVFAISNERRFSPRTLYAIGAGFSGIPPWQAIGLGVARAARYEFRHAASRLLGRTRS